MGAISKIGFLRCFSLKEFVSLKGLLVAKTISILLMFILSTASLFTSTSVQLSFIFDNGVWGWGHIIETKYVNTLLLRTNNVVKFIFWDFSFFFCEKSTLFCFLSHFDEKSVKFNRRTESSTDNFSRAGFLS